MRTVLVLGVLLAFPANAQPHRPFDPEEPARRAAAAKARLEASPAGKVVLRSIETHGGLSTWFGGRAVKFRYRYEPVGDNGTVRDSVQTIDLLGSRAYHQMTEPVRGFFAWTGERAWADFAEPEKAAIRFWALTPYYFVGMPFVLGDPGVKLEMSADDPAAAGLPPADVVKISFEDGTGDAPDDYYIAYVAKDDGRLLAVRYVVSYKPFMAKRGIEHTPEKLLVYSGFRAAGDLRLARTHTFYAFAAGKRGQKVTDAMVSEVEHGVKFDESKLVMPEGAHVDKSLDMVQK